MATRPRLSGPFAIAVDWKRDHNLEQPVNCLPVEILGYIFELALEELRDTWPSEAYDDIRLVVTSVCTWWRAIAIASPTLWGTLVYQDDEDVTLWSNRWTLLCLSRSGDADLEISISVDLTDDQEESDEQFSRMIVFMEAVKKHWPRVTSFMVQSRNWRAFDSIFPLPDSGPRLRGLDVDIAGLREFGDMASFRFFPSQAPSTILARNHPNLHTLKLGVYQLSVDELVHLIRAVPHIRVLRIKNHGTNFDEPDREVLRLKTPKLEQLTLINSSFPSTTFSSPLIQHITYDLPAGTVTKLDPCPDFFPDFDEPPYIRTPPAKLSLGDVRDSLDFFEPAVRLLRAYRGVATLRLHGRRALGKLLCAAFGSSEEGVMRITAPGAKEFEGLEAPRALRCLEIMAWDSEEVHQQRVLLPDPGELTELAEVLLELLKNSPALHVQWWSLHDPTSVAHPAYERLRKACESLISQFPTRIVLKLA